MISAKYMSPYIHGMQMDRNQEKVGDDGRIYFHQDEINAGDSDGPFLIYSPKSEKLITVKSILLWKPTD